MAKTYPIGSDVFVEVVPLWMISTAFDTSSLGGGLKVVEDDVVRVTVLASNFVLDVLFCCDALLWDPSSLEMFPTISVGIEESIDVCIVVFDGGKCPFIIIVVDSFLVVEGNIVDIDVCGGTDVVDLDVSTSIFFTPLCNTVIVIGNKDVSIGLRCDTLSLLFTDDIFATLGPT